MSHEFKTPLTGIQGAVELLQDHPDMEADRRRRFLDNIAGDARRLSALVTRLLDLARADMARPEAGVSTSLRAPVLKAVGLYFSQAIIWDKQHPVLTRKDFMGAHEWCFYSWREGAAHQFFGPANATDLWHVKKVNPQSMIHLTEKPVELAVRAMQYSSRAGENVLDLFGGSGSTLIAAEQTSRHAFLMELDPLYSDVIVQRWEKFTGKQAERVPA